MTDDPVRQDGYPTVNFVLDAIAGWVNKYRASAGARDELGQCGPEDVRQIANDLGISVGDLRTMSAKSARRRPDGQNAHRVVGGS